MIGVDWPNRSRLDLPSNRASHERVVTLPVEGYACIRARHYPFGVINRDLQMAFAQGAQASCRRVLVIPACLRDSIAMPLASPPVDLGDGGGLGGGAGGGAVD
jgi:hypothetical protein